MKTLLAIVTLLAFAMSGTACGDDDTDGSATDTPVVSASPTPGVAASPTAGQRAACPVDAAAVCDEAKPIADALLLGDVDGVMAFAAPQAYTCPSPDVTGAGGPFPLCEDAPEGEVRQGFPHAHLQSEGGAQSDAEVRTLLGAFVADADGSATDSFGDGAPRVATIGCSPVESGIDCPDRFGLVFTKISAGAGRSLLELVVDRNEGDPSFTWIITGVVNEGLNNELIAGGTSDLPLVFDGASRPPTIYVPYAGASDED
jgi:hypothetical protein